MPGIAGIISKHVGPETEHDMRRMVASMRHESHHRGGQRLFVQAGICVGWMAHQGGFDDCMPLISRTKDIVLIFQGENFLDADTLRELKRSKSAVDETTARHLLDLYDEHGDGFIGKLNGWFSGVLIDLR